MYDELIQRLRLAKAVLSRNKDLIALLSDAAEAIEELQGRAKVLEKVADKWCEAVPKWIPVTERLPDSGVPTLICGDGNVVEQGFFDDEYGYWYDWGGNRTFVHHWMPLPQPPKEDNHAES
jgi:hypothetical protein